MMHPPSWPPRSDRRRPDPESGTPLPPDRILRGGSVWTGLDPLAPPMEGWAVALRGRRITRVGPEAPILASRDARTVVVDVEGGAILPGFVDAHVHLQAGGLELFRVDLRGATSPEALILRVRDRARLLPPGAWVLGGGWDHHAWGGTLPTRAWLDEAAPEHPVFLLRLDMHVGVANSRALALAGVDRDTPDPERGRVDREPATGEPTGLLLEGALELLSRVIPPPSAGDREAALMAGMQHALQHGVTQLHDMGALQSADESWASLETLRDLHARGKVPLRVSAAVPLSERHRLEALVAAEGGGDSRLRWGAVKGFVDGSLGGATAWFLEDYQDLPGERGGPIVDPEELEAGIVEAASMGLQPIVHAIGDAATAWLVEVYEGILRSYPGRDLRLRMEHAQHLAPATLARLGHPGIVCSMQPCHLHDDAPWAERRLGADRLGGAYALRGLLERGARPAFGSDWTVAPLDPRVNLDAAVHRRPGRQMEAPPWVPGQRISLGEALRAHTLDAARAGFLEVETGSLEPGKRADLVVLDRSPFHLSPEESFAALQVRATLVDGAPAWEAVPGSFPQASASREDELSSTPSPLS